MAISLKTAGTWARLVVDGTVAIPGTPAAGDRMFLFASWKTYTITVTDPDGWTPIGTEFADGTVAAGNATGSVKVMAWYRDWQTGDGDPTIAWSANPTEGHAVVMLWQKGAGEVWTTPLTVTAAIAAATPFSATASSTLTVPDASVVMCLVGLRDNSTGFTRSATTAIEDDGTPNVTWNGNYVESPAAHFDSTTGFDMSGDLGHRFVTTGAAGVSLTTTGTPDASETGSAKWVVQGVATSNPILCTPTTLALTTALFAPTVSVTNNVLVTVPTAGGGTAAAHVQNLGAAGNQTAGQTSTVLSPASKTVTVGNTIVVGWGGYFDITPSGVTDNLGNTYTRIERTRRTQATADLWSAPVTTGGSITTITVAHASTQYVAIIASELSGVAGSPAIGGGATGQAGTDQTADWATDVTLPANGLTIGDATSSSGTVHVAGPASGTPSTTVILVAETRNGGIGFSLGYAVSGSEVVNFTGSNDVGAGGADWAAAGAIFSPSGSVGLVLATFAPTITVGANVTVTPDVVALTTALFAPTVTTPQTVTPDLVALTTATFAPTISIGANVVVTPDVVALTTSTFAPNVTAGGNVTVTPGVATLTTATFAPTAATPIITTPQPVGGAFPYGPAVGMDGLGNLAVGTAGNQRISYRFRAEQSSALVSVRLYWMQLGAYGGGNGGTIRITVQTDDGSGLPSGTVLATQDYVNPVEYGGFLTTFASPATLTAGVIYHLHFQNIDADPATNWASLNTVWILEPTTPRQPRWPDMDFRSLRRQDLIEWIDTHDGSSTPIVDFGYANGLHQGNGYMEVEWVNEASITGANTMARERFTVSNADRVVHSASVRVARTSGTGDLVVRLEESDGTLLESFNVPYTDIPIEDSGIAGPAGLWVTGTFSSPITLAKDQTYHLRLSTDASTIYWTRGFEQGIFYGYHSSTYFADGTLQVTTNGVDWAYVTGLDLYGDMQFYLGSVASLPLTTFAPTVTATANVSVTPDVVNLTTATFAPTVTTGGNVAVTPDLVALSLTAFAPDTVLTDHQLATPTTATLTTATFAPVVTATAHQTVTPDLVALTLTTFVPEVTASGAVVPDRVDLVLATFVPTVTATNHQTVTPGLLALTTALFAPTVAVGSPSLETLPEMDEVGATITTRRIGTLVTAAAVEATITTTSIGAEVT